MRRSDWPEALASFVQARMRRPFAWGGQDCCMTAADWVLLATGEDPAAEYRGKYTDEAAALTLIDEAGGLMAMITLPDKPINLAQRGDVVLARVDGRESLGIVDVGGWWGPGARGLVFRPMTDAVIAFEV